MLGIRHYKQFAIDLWQGDITHFVSDVTCCFWLEAGRPLNEESTKIVMSMTNNLKSEANDALFKNKHFDQDVELNYVKKLIHFRKPQLTKDIFQILFSNSHEANYRHVCIPNMASMVASEQVMIELKQVLDQLDQSSVTRITFISENSETYQQMQEALFKTFN